MCRRKQSILGGIRLKEHCGDEQNKNVHCCSAVRKFKGVLSGQEAENIHSTKCPLPLCSLKLATVAFLTTCL